MQATTTDPRNDPANRRPGCQGMSGCRCAVSTPCVIGTSTIRALNVELGDRLGYYGAGHGPETDRVAENLRANLDALNTYGLSDAQRWDTIEARRTLETYENQRATIEYLRAGAAG